MTRENDYLETQVMTATPHQLHLMVIDGAIRHTAQAEAAIGEEDYETAHFAMNNARGFVSELISRLDRRTAPELVDQLKAVFFFVYRNLVDADVERDAQKLRDSLQVLRQHREAWVELCEKLKTETTDESIPGHLPHQIGERRSWIR